MQSFITSTRGAFRAAITAGAVALTLAGAVVATARPAEAFVRHGGRFHGGGFHGGHRFGSGFGRHRFGAGYRFGGLGRARFGGYGYGVRRFVYGVGVPYGGYGLRRCTIGRHFVPGLGCRVDAVYRYRAVRRIVGPIVGFGPHRFGGRGFGHGFGRPIGGYRHGFRTVGFGHGGFGHGGFGHGGGPFRRH